jgi:hypothetical protein
VSRRDLPGHDGIVVAHVRQKVVEAVLELDVRPHPELLQVERSRHPVDADGLSDTPYGCARLEIIGRVDDVA